MKPNHPLFVFSVCFALRAVGGGAQGEQPPAEPPSRASRAADPALLAAGHRDGPREQPERGRFEARHADPGRRSLIRQRGLQTLPSRRASITSTAAARRRTSSSARASSPAPGPTTPWRGTSSSRPAAATTSPGRISARPPIAPSPGSTPSTTARSERAGDPAARAELPAQPGQAADPRRPEPRAYIAQPVRSAGDGHVRDVSLGYLDLVFSIRDLEVARQSLKLAQDLLRNNRIQVEVGTMAPIDVLEAEAEVAAPRRVRHPRGSRDPHL